jgi:hypothetical protein
MTSQGTAHARFQRAIQRGPLLAAETAARKLGTLSLSDALSLCPLYEGDRDPWLERGDAALDQSDAARVCAPRPSRFGFWS